MAEQLDLDLDLSGAKKDIAELKALLLGLGDSGRAAFEKIGTSGKKASDEVGKAFDVGVGQGVADALNDIEKEFKDLEKAANTLRGALGRAVDPDAIKLYAKSIADLERGMLELRTAAKQAGASIDTVGKSSKGLGTAKEVAEGFFGSFAKAALIVSAVQAVISFTKESFNLARQVAKTERQFAGFVGGIDNAKKAIAQFNKAANEVKIPEREFQQAAKALLGFGFSAKDTEAALKRTADIAKGSGKDFNELAVIYGKAKASGVLFAEDINQLTEAGIPIIGQFAKQLGVSTDQVKKLASEGKIGFAELELAFANLTKQGSLYAGQAVANADATDQLSASWQKLKTQAGEFLAPAINSVVLALNDIVTAASKLFKADSIGNYFKNALDFVVQLTPATKILTDQLKKNAPQSDDQRESNRKAGIEKLRKQRMKDEDETFRLENNAKKERDKLAAESDKKLAEERAKKQRERDQLLINAMKEGLDKELAQENLRFKVLRSELVKARINTEQSEEQHQKNLNEIKLRYYLIAINEQAKQLEEEADALKRGNAEIEQLTKDEIDARRARLKESEDVTNQFAELATETFNQQQLTNRAKFFEVERSEKEIKEFEKKAATEAEILELEIQKRKVNNALFFNKELTDVERQTLDTRLEVINEKISQLKNGIGEGAAKDDGNFLLKLLGIDPKDSKEFESALEDAVSSIKSSLDQIIDLRIDAAQQEVDIQSQKVSDLEALLGVEKERQAQGFANDVKVVEDQLSLARSAQQRAIEDRKRAQKAELAVDTASQISNTAVAVTNIIRDYSKIPFVGVLLGLAQVASLFAFLQSARARNKAINAAQFRDGGEATITKDNVLAGPSHAKGGIGIEAEGGEAVFSDGKKLAITSKRMTSKHFDLIKAINRDDVPKMRDIVDGMMQGRQTFNHGVSDSTPKPSGSASTARLEYLQKKNNALTEQTTRAVKERPLVVQKNGKTVIIKKNRQTTIG